MSAIKSTALASLFALAALSIVPQSANATVINYTALTPGQHSVVTGPFTITANPGGRSFETKTVNGVTGVGVTGSNSQVAGEIDFVESISFQSMSSQTLNGFTVAFLYPIGVMGDTVNEIAAIDATGGVVAHLLLTATATGGATLTGVPGATVTILSSGTSSGGGEFAVSGLNIGFTSLAFQAGNPGNTAAASDFAFVNMTYTVPEPASLALLSVGMIATGITARRRQSKTVQAAC